jgi:hypothetical protein
MTDTSTPNVPNDKLIEARRRKATAAHHRRMAELFRQMGRMGDAADAERAAKLVEGGGAEGKVS